MQTSPIERCMALHPTATDGHVFHCNRRTFVIVLDANGPLAAYKHFARADRLEPRDIIRVGEGLQVLDQMLGYPIGPPRSFRLENQHAQTFELKEYPYGRKMFHAMFHESV